MNKQSPWDREDPNFLLYGSVQVSESSCMGCALATWGWENSDIAPVPHLFVQNTSFPSSSFSKLPNLLWTFQTFLTNTDQLFSFPGLPAAQTCSGHFSVQLYSDIQPPAPCTLPPGRTAGGWAVDPLGHSSPGSAFQATLQAEPTILCSLGASQKSPLKDSAYQGNVAQP